MSSDEELLQRWGGGSSDAGNALVARHFDSMYRFFRTKCPAEIDDLIQRTFLVAVEQRSKFRGESTFRAFLFGIARNVLFEHLRQRRKDGRIDPYSTSAHALNPEAINVVAHRQEQRYLLAGLRQLPLDDQIALELRYWDQLPSDDIGQVLGLSGGSARSRIKRARERLESVLAEIIKDPSQLQSTTDNLERWASSLRAAIIEDNRPATSPA